MNQVTPPCDSLTEEGRYRLLVESVTDYAIYMLDPSGVVTSWNPGAQRFKGYRADEILGQNFSRFYTPEDRAAGLPRRALAIAADEDKFESEGWRVRKDGSRFWAHVVIDPIRSPDGRLLGFAKITRDLTERRRAELDLQQSQEQFRRLVLGVTDYAIYMLDPAGYVSNWNPGAQRIKGYTPEEAVGSHFSRFYTEDDRARGEPQKALETATREGRYEREAWRVRKDGSRFMAHVVIDAIRDDNGQIVGFAKITRDITERRETQIELEKAQAALFQSQKMDAVGQLTGGIAHDFNNLLMAVLGSLELLGKRLPDDPAMRRLLDNATQGAKRGSALTQRMLSFARRQALELKPLDVPELVRGMTDLLQRSLGPSIVIVTDFSAPPGRAEADQNQLELALLNLAMNGRDAMAGGGTLTIAAHEEMVGAGHATGLAAGTYICLSVADQGEGMDEETLAKAVEPFFTTKGIGKGTGLGLPMVHGMAEQSGGRFILKSTPGEGTVAEIWLPLAKGAALPDQLPPEEESSNGRTLTVLAVDDDILVLFNTTALLEDMGHQPVEAHSAEEALAILKSRKIDLVITDQAMPHMTGAQLLGEIRKLSPHLPVILATGYAELPPGVKSDAVMLAKPFDERALADAIVKAAG